jgi:hypothetical protein
MAKRKYNRYNLSEKDWERIRQSGIAKPTLYERLRCFDGDLDKALTPTIKKSQVSAQLPPRLKVEVKGYAIAHKLSTSEVIRLAVEEFFKTR